MDDEFWYCLKHHEVEGREGCPWADRLGPYPSAEQAARALEKVAERNAQWDADDGWNGSKQGDPSKDTGR